MKIEIKNPPNFDLISKVFKLHKGIVFTYGDTLYNPDNAPLDEFILAHEEVHVKQQKDPKRWWFRYISDKDFRFVQELEAYQAQYSAFCNKFKDKNRQNGFLDKLGEVLSGKIYGNICSKTESMNAIKNKVKFKITEV